MIMISARQKEASTKMHELATLENPNSEQQILKLGLCFI